MLDLDHLGLEWRGTRAGLLEDHGVDRAEQFAQKRQLAWTAAPQLGQ